MSHINTDACPWGLIRWLRKWLCFNNVDENDCVWTISTPHLKPWKCYCPNISYRQRIQESHETWNNEPSHPYSALVIVIMRILFLKRNVLIPFLSHWFYLVTFLSIADIFTWLFLSKPLRSSYFTCNKRSLCSALNTYIMSLWFTLCLKRMRVLCCQKKPEQPL